MHSPFNREASLREIQLRPNTNIADLKRKADSARNFLDRGEQVRFTVRFRGREMAHPHIGELNLRWLITSCADMGVAHGEPRLEGKQMTVVINPRKRG